MGKSALELLLLFTLAVATIAQTPPQVTRFIDDTVVQVNVSTDTSMSLTCPNRDGFIAVSDQKRSSFVSNSPSFTVDLSYTKGDWADLQRMRRQKLGAYHCLYQDAGQVNAHSIVLSERPTPEQILNSDIRRVGTGHGEDQFEPYCRVAVTDTSEYVWESYDDKSALFKEHSFGQMLQLSYTALSREHGNGMTIYRCYSKRNPEVIQYSWAMYSDNLQIRPVRASDYESTPLPYSVRYQSPITLECHGNGSTTVAARPTWLFKPDGSDTYKPVTDDSPALEIKFLATLSTLTLQRMLPKYSGFYRCDKDGINHAVQLKVNFGDVVIRDYSKATVPLVQENYITCEIPEKSMKEDASFILHRLGKPPLTLKGASTSDGFTTSFDSQGNLVIRFSKRSDVEDARLVCSFHGSSDFAYIKTELPKLILSDGGSRSNYFFVLCKKDREFGTDKDLKVHALNEDGTLGKAMNPTPGTVTESRAYDTRTDAAKFVEFVCVTDYDGQQLRSNILPFGTPAVIVDLFVEGEKNPPRRVFLGGRDVTLECLFKGIPSTRVLRPSGVSLMKDERKLSLPQEIVNATAFRYVIRNTGSSDTGVYRCDYANSGLYRASISLVGSFRSSDSNLQFCTGSQFVCDSTCKDASLMCDKKSDCADGADERPEYCEKCEPNEVKCESHNGRNPEKRCVLKHWLCDGQDDCGNGFDENLSLHSDWCFKDANCRSCRPEETCCPNLSNKCIQRNYECDKENDCDGGSEELRCSASQCLRITDPTSRRIVEKRVGEPLVLSCTAVGMDRPTINWRRNWAALPKDGVAESNQVIERDFPGDYTVRGSLSFTSITKDMAGIYNCEAVNNCKRELSYEIDLRVLD